MSMGRFWTAFLILGIVGVVVMFFVAGESSTTAGSRFMAALSQRDLKTLADMTYVEGKSPEQIKAEWKSCLDANEYYRFTYNVVGADTPKEGEAMVRITLQKNVTSSSYDENYTLKMFKKPDGWKVDVANLNRDLYPWLPHWSR